MDRREFLVAGLAATSTLRFRSSHGQPRPATRGAVVIGIDKARDLKPLKAACSGAKSIADWLGGEGFEVRLLTDQAQPVGLDDIFRAVDGFVQKGTFEQLVVYFAGHGFISGTLSEFWMLSDALRNPNQAVDMTVSAKYAEECGIPNVVFISDACRSRAESLGIQRQTGGTIFPATTNPRKIADVDQFLAARLGAAAYETAPVANPAAAEGIFTRCFLEAFKHPYPSMIQTVDGRPVVPNRRLKDYLAAEVPKRAQALSIAYNQQPDSKVYSEEPTYIAHVSGAASEPSSVTATLSDVAAVEIGTRGFNAEPPQSKISAIKALRVSSGFGLAKEKIEEVGELSVQLTARTGFTVSGRHLQSIVTRPGITSKFTNASSGFRPTALVEMDLGPAEPFASVVLRFTDGTGTVLAALRDYVGNVVVSAAGVRNVNYIPSVQSPLRSAYEHEAPKLESLRASVATAAQFGVFRFDGPKETRRAAAASMADRIRILKGIDPTLGVYAAYAYDDAGLKDKVDSVYHYMRPSLQCDLFDVAMLAGDLSGKPLEARKRIVPFCPMMSQGWGLLPVKKAQLPEGVVAARDYLRVSLWNTLAQPGVDIVEDALQSGGFS